MTRIRTIAPAEATGLLAEVYNASCQVQGRVFNIEQAASLKPEVLQTWNAFKRSLIFSASSLGRRREELIAMVISAINRCKH
jgi:hypothetical protein